MSTHDAFYTLPDSLVAFILSKMPIKDAVKSSILSKRWRFLYTQMPQLTFTPHDIFGPTCSSRYPLIRPSVEQIISNILVLHSGNLEAFHLHGTRFDFINRREFSHDSVCKWVRYASWCNVKHLTLFDCNTHDALKEMLPPALFSCTHLVTLRLRNYFLTSFPINFIGFPHLITCELRDVQLTDGFLVSLISLCPLLQKLEAIRHAGLDNAAIFSSTIEHLYLESVKSLSVNCPKLKILSGYRIENLSVNGVRFYELSFAISNVEMHCGGTLRKLTMCFSQGQRNNPGIISASRFLHIMGNFQSLKTLVIHMSNPFEREPDMDVYVFNLLHKLPNLQELSISGLFVQELARDPIPVCLTPPHLYLKKVRIGLCGFDLDNKEVAVISCLLQSMPSLELLEIQLPDVYDDDDGQIFIDDGQCLKLLKDILYMRRASLLARIVVLD
ncbi:hypothetical protein SUGI_0061620 [Cryptomeria japonica]|uniref:FBD-associated F-box protein At2g26860 n=1 Tax=Cryptomeria japonica TaxID=3369 RepID=UPI00240894F5|nr:FBD-associated F-box protein At2g26860 [Cryptomeria japonica]GLJ07208.1 hypothetical protein SUGI_0061620 [Cryptomeria japonica]